MTVEQIFEEKNSEVFSRANVDPNTNIEDLTDEQIKNLEEQYKLVAQNGIGLKNNNSNNLDAIFEQIKDLIDSGELSDKDKLIEYINNMDLDETMKNELINKSCDYLNSKTKDTQITSFKDKLFSYLRKQRKEGTGMLVNMEVKSNAIGEQLCNIKLTGVMNGDRRDLEDYTFYYTDELKKELIEPVIEEVVLKDPVTYNDYAQSSASLGYRSDYCVSTSTNAQVNLNNIEQEYADFIKGRVNGLADTTKLSNPSDRDAKINDLKNDRNIGKDVMKLTKTKKENGFISICYITALVSIAVSMYTFISALLK